MAADIIEPAKKYFVYNNGKAQMYQPKSIRSRNLVRVRIKVTSKAIWYWVLAAVGTIF